MTINSNHPFDSKCFLRIILFSYLEILMVRDVELFLVFRIHAQDPPLWSSNLRGTFARGSNHMVVCVSVNMGYDLHKYTWDQGSSVKLCWFAFSKLQKAFSREIVSSCPTSGVSNPAPTRSVQKLFNWNFRKWGRWPPLTASKAAWPPTRLCWTARARLTGIGTSFLLGLVSSEGSTAAWHT